MPPTNGDILGGMSIAAVIRGPRLAGRTDVLLWGPADSGTTACTCNFVRQLRGLCLLLPRHGIPYGTATASSWNGSYKVLTPCVGTGVGTLQVPL